MEELIEVGDSTLGLRTLAPMGFLPYDRQSFISWEYMGRNQTIRIVAYGLILGKILSAQGAAWPTQPFTGWLYVICPVGCLILDVIRKELRLTPLVLACEIAYFTAAGRMALQVGRLVLPLGSLLFSLLCCSMAALAKPSVRVHPATAPLAKVLLLLCVLPVLVATVLVGHRYGPAEGLFIGSVLQMLLCVGSFAIATLLLTSLRACAFVIGAVTMKCVMMTWWGL